MQPARLPRPLHPGATVAVIAPASPMPNPADVPVCLAVAEQMGFRVKPYPTLDLRDDFQAGSAAQRAADVQRAFADPEVDAILSIRGGYSTQYILPLLDWRAIAASAKVFSGFSDLTALLNPMALHAGLAGLHAPTLSYFRKPNDLTSASLAAWKAFLTGEWLGVSYRSLCGSHLQPVTIRGGCARGVIVGGNAAVLAALIGTPYLPMEGPFILFLEDIGEKPYRVDRFVTQMIQSGFIDQVAGIVLGQFTDCDPGDARDDVMTILRRQLEPLGKPVVAGFPIGHDQPSYPLPIGVMATLDADAGELTTG
jgi:muramoyltetrapeptide carboxypeptidase